MTSTSETLQCYELLTMQYLEQSQDESIWHKLRLWNQNQLSAVQVIVSLPKELWFVAIFLRDNPQRLREFLDKFSRISLLNDEEDLLVNYLQSFNLSELYLDTTFRSNLESSHEHSFQSNNTLTTTQIGQNVIFRPPLAIFR